MHPPKIFDHPFLFVFCAVSYVALRTQLRLRREAPRGYSAHETAYWRVDYGSTSTVRAFVLAHTSTCRSTCLQFLCVRDQVEYKNGMLFVELLDPMNFVFAVSLSCHDLTW